MGLYLPRRVAERPAIVFLSDFREVIRGIPEPGSTCNIVYDPSRIVPAEGYDPATEHSSPAMRSVWFICPPTSHPVFAHLQFRPNGTVVDVPLASPSGRLEKATIRKDGRGVMLYGEFSIPPDAEWIQVWFTHDDGHGRTLYDSRFGANYMFRFIDRDLQVLEAVIKPAPDQVTAVFSCKVETASYVRSVGLRYRIVSSQPDAHPTHLELVRSAQPESQTRAIWTSGEIGVPRHAVIAFDLIYYVGEQRFKEDNQGTFFLVNEEADMAQNRGDILAMV